MKNFKDHTITTINDN